MKKYIPKKAGLLACLGLALSGCASVDGVLMSRKVKEGLESSAYSLGISENQVVSDANIDGNRCLTQEEHNNYRLNHIGEFRAKDLPSLEAVATMIGLPLTPPYDPDRENR